MGIVIVIESMIPPRTHLYLYIVVDVHVRVSTEYRTLLNPLSLRFSLLVLSIFFSPSPVCYLSVLGTPSSCRRRRDLIVPITTSIRT